ncbi:MAG: TonB-dependent receptor [Bacteroidales bacterium]|nr:TonB-dependent receptor [Bacteroidales bacterium]
MAQKYTISGYIRDVESGEELIGANIVIKPLNLGAVANKYGFYSLTVPEGEYVIEFSFISFKTITKNIQLKSNQKLNIELYPESLVADEVVVSAEKSDVNIKSKEMSVITMPVERIKELPVLFGETDILKSIQLLPGVQSGGEGSSGFYVRGGGPDQNLILLDEAVVYNASHLMGFMSVFNADVISDVKLIKGGMPAEYGGRLSSVLDISTKNGNDKSYHAKGGLGLISSRLVLEGPIQKNKSSFIVSGRRTYADLLFKPFAKEGSKMEGFGYYFYDLNLKANYRFTDKDRLYLSGYFGRDVFGIDRKSSGLKLSIPWGNATASLRWNHLFSDKFFANTTVVFSDYNFEFNGEQQDFEFKLFSGLRDYNAKIDFSYLAWVRHQIKFGANYTNHTFTPTSVTAKIGDTSYDSGKIIKQYANEYALYLGDNFDITEKISVYGGLRWTYFQQVGPYDRYVKNMIGENIDTLTYAIGQEIVNYHYPEPRFSMRWILNSKSSVKASYSQNYQYVHLANVASASLPTDLWVSSSEVVKPQFSVQYALGYFRNFFNNALETSVEVYYKTMDNMIAYKDGAQPSDDGNDNPDNNFTFGKGLSYGAEFFINKKVGKFTGWIGYTWSITNRQFDDINHGEWYPAKYDRRHDLSVLANYQFSKRWSVSAVFVFATGNTMTMPVSRYFIDGRLVTEYGPRNSYRMNDYHRLDLSITFKAKEIKKFKSYWNLSIYNVYNRSNPYFIYFEEDGSLYEGNLKITPYQVSLFPILPSISWNFEF